MVSNGCILQGPPVILVLPVWSRRTGPAQGSYVRHHLSLLHALSSPHLHQLHPQLCGNLAAPLPVAAMATTNVPVTLDTPIVIKVLFRGQTKKFKLPLKDLGAHVLPGKVRCSSCLSFSLY